jgi:crossover junction endodeoxyribonuclease RusA
MIDLMFQLPWPPSINRYWRNFKGRTIISKDGRDYRAAVIGKLGKGGPILSDRLAVEIYAYPPDNRRRDLDNVIKVPMDCLTHAGIWKDDSLIDDLRIVRKAVERNGRLMVRVRQINES